MWPTSAHLDSVLHLLERHSPVWQDGLTGSQRSVEESFRLRHIGTSQCEGRNPARVTWTSRWTAALDGRLLATVRACRQ